jgi:hypothetical protein
MKTYKIKASKLLAYFFQDKEDFVNMGVAIQEALVTTDDEITFSLDILATRLCSVPTYYLEGFDGDEDEDVDGSQLIIIND